MIYSLGTRNQGDVNGTGSEPDKTGAGRGVAKNANGRTGRKVGGK